MIVPAGSARSEGAARSRTSPGPPRGPRPTCRRSSEASLCRAIGGSRAWRPPTAFLGPSGGRSPSCSSSSTTRNCRGERRDATWTVRRRWNGSRSAIATPYETRGRLTSRTGRRPRSQTTASRRFLATSWRGRRPTRSVPRRRHPRHRHRETALRTPPVAVRVQSRRRAGRSTGAKWQVHLRPLLELGASQMRPVARRSTGAGKSGAPRIAAPFSSTRRASSRLRPGLRARQVSRRREAYSSCETEKPVASVRHYKVS